MEKIKNKIIVMSGKGGVGKSTVSANIACGLALKGKKVGLLDVDLHGPNIPKMLGIEGQRMHGTEKLLFPLITSFGLKVVSIASLLDDPNKPIIWRGPLKTSTINQFVNNVDWGELDYLIIDSPPGTGDEPLSACQAVDKINGAIIVSTPQDVAILDSKKSILFAKELNISFIGVIENMSGFNCPHCNHEIDIFSTGGAQKAASEFNVTFLGKIPILSDIVKRSDNGKVLLNFNDTDIIYNHLKNIIEKLIVHFEKKEEEIHV